MDSRVELIKHKGCVLLFKKDLKSAYHQLLPIDLGDYLYLGHIWRKQYYFDGTMPMGLSTAALVNWEKVDEAFK